MQNNNKYLDLINTFDAYAIAEKLSIYEITLFNYLKAKINWNFWNPNYSIHTSIICKELNISRPKFIQTRQKLKQRNLISFDKGEFKKPPKYNLIPTEKWILNNFNNSNDFYKKFISKQRSINQVQKTENQKNFCQNFQNKKEACKPGLRVNQVNTCDAPRVNQVNTYKDNSYTNNRNIIYFNYVYKTVKNDFSLCEKSQKNENVFFDLKKNQNLESKTFFQKNTTQQSLTKSVNSEEEKRKKVAPKKEKRFLHQKEPLNHKLMSGEVIIPKTNKSSLNETKTPLKRIPVSRKQIEMYISERGNKISPNDFITYYAKKGWKIKKHWHLLVKQWERNKRKKEAKELQQKVSVAHTYKKVVGGAQLSFDLEQTNNVFPLNPNGVTYNASGSNVNQLNDDNLNPNGVTYNASGNEDKSSNEGSEKTLNVLDKPKQRTAKKSVFKVPTMQEIQDFCQEENLTHTDPYEFFNHYESLEWMVGRNKMKNWKAAARGWHARTKRWAKEAEQRFNQYKKTYVKKEENIEPTIGRMKLSDVKKMMTGWD